MLFVNPYIPFANRCSPMILDPRIAILFDVQPVTPLDTIPISSEVALYALISLTHLKTYLIKHDR